MSFQGYIVGDPINQENKGYTYYGKKCQIHFDLIVFDTQQSDKRIDVTITSSAKQISTDCSLTQKLSF